MDLSQAPAWLQAFILGLAQGLTEFLPISSSGHLILIPRLAGWPLMGKDFDVALHLGTLLAIALYFRDDVRALFRGLYSLLGNWRFILSGKVTELDYEPRLVFMLALSSIPAGLLGLFLHQWLEDNFSQVGTIAFFLGAFGLLMYFAEKWGSQRYELAELTVRGALMIGLAQACALMPGVSRSGATMTMALLLGLTRAESARFSFLMALPITAAAILLSGIKVAVKYTEDGDTSFFVPCLIGVVVSAVSGWLCIHYLMRYLKTRTFTPFVVYRVILALLLGLWIWQN